MLQIPITSWEEVYSWYVVVEELSSPSSSSRKQMVLSEVIQKDSDGKAILPLEHPSLLGKAVLGEYRVKLRSRGALGRDKQFQFAFIREVDFEFDRAFYLANQTPKLTLLTSSTIKVLSEDASTIAIGSAGSFEITSKSQARQFTLNLQSEDHRKLPITFTIPRLRWALKNFNNELSVGWLDEPREVSFDDFAASDEAILVVESPLPDGTLCVLELQGADHKSEQKIRRGEARFGLRRFIDSLRALAKSLARFRLSFVGGSNHLPAVYPLSVHTHWVLENFECQDVPIISFKWKESSQFKNRKLRLWNLLCIWEPPKEYSVPDGVSELTIQENALPLASGLYRVESFLESEYGIAPLDLPSQKNGENIFDIEIGRTTTDPQEQAAKTFSFRGYLTIKLLAIQKGLDLGLDLRKLAQSEQLQNYNLTEEDIALLVQLLIFLIQEGKTVNAKNLWFTELHNQLRQMPLRNAVHEQLKSYAEGGDEQTKQKILDFCEIIGISITALMPFEKDLKVVFEKKVVLIRGINSGLIKLEYQDLTRWVSLERIGEMTLTSYDASLSRSRTISEDKEHRKRLTRLRRDNSV